MKKNSGFTVIELIIVLAIIAILGAVVFNALNRDSDGTRCRGGYKFVDNGRGVAQVLDSEGHGIPCEKK